MELFHQGLVRQYRQMVLQAVIECEHDYKTRLDIGKLNHRLTTIIKSARMDGISRGLIDQIIDECMPSKMNRAA